MATRCKSSVVFCAFFIFINIVISNSFANNLEISNVQLSDREPSENTIVIEFDIAWENSWRTKINHDAIWLTARLSNPSAVPTDKKLCQMTFDGLNPDGAFVGTDDSLEIFVPADKTGAFLRPANYGVYSNVASTGVQLTLDYSTCGFSNTDTVHVSVFGVEMVLVPEAAYFAGDYSTSTASLVQGSSDSDPWYVSDANGLSVSDPASNGFRYVSASQAGEDATGSSFVLDATFPNGFTGVLCDEIRIDRGSMG